MSDCTFCKIAAGESPAKTVFENDRVIVFKDIHPKAKTHLLITPKAHFPTFLDTPNEDVAYLFEIARQLGEKLHVANGFKLWVHNGPEGGQVIFHLHVHFMTNLASVGDDIIDIAG